MYGATLAAICLFTCSFKPHQQKIISDFPQCAIVSGRIRMMSKTMETKRQLLRKNGGQELLSNVPYEKGFHFYTEMGKYTGITATSLDEFAGKLQTIPVESVSFHFQRDDFQNWLRNTVGDGELAGRIDQLKKWPSWSSDENLRKELVKTVQKRLSELRTVP